MHKPSIAMRLRIIMWERNWSESDILSACQPFCKMYGVKLDRKDIEYYVSDKLAPAEDKLFIIALALNVSKRWLLGFNTPRERPPHEK